MFEKLFAKRFVKVLSGLVNEGGPVEVAIAAYVTAVLTVLRSRHTLATLRCLRVAFAEGWKAARDGVVAYREAGGTKAMEAIVSAIETGMKPGEAEEAAAKEVEASLPLDKFMSEAKRFKADLLEFWQWQKELEDDEADAA